MPRIASKKGSLKHVVQEKMVLNEEAKLRRKSRPPKVVSISQSETRASTVLGSDVNWVNGIYSIVLHCAHLLKAQCPLEYPVASQSNVATKLDKEWHPDILGWTTRFF